MATTKTGVTAGSDTPRSSGTDTDGLTAAEAASRLATVGHNRLGPVHRVRGWRLLAAQFINPIVLILILATILAIILGDLTDGLIILIIIGASGVLGFVQEHRAGNAVDELTARVRIHTDVLRDGVETPLPIDDVVPGDVVVLRAGDVIPADGRVFTSRNMLVDEAAISGESFPVEKGAGQGNDDRLYMGTHVISGEARAVMERTGSHTEYAAVYRRLASADVTTSFEKGMTRFGFMLVRVMIILVAAILVINLVLHRPVIESILFSLALAVGLTPQLLPAIVAVSLAAGARRMAAAKVIVKRLDAIEDLGGMTTLCTDKTGTLTIGAIRLDQWVDLDGRTSADVLRLAAVNAGLQRGFANPMDDAIVAVAGPPTGATALDEMPYDFTRRRLSILADEAGGRVLVTKGAFADIVSICTTARVDAGPVPLDTVVDGVTALVERLSAGGFRVLAVAERSMPDAVAITEADEREMTLCGLLAFHDPIKPNAAETIEQLRRLGVSLRLITGDNRLAAKHIAGAIGLPGDVLAGAAIDDLSDAELAERAGSVAVFAEVEPLAKERIVKALRARGEVVGFLGDGINDTPALHAADVGISVDSAVDVAKQTAAVVLLDHGLHVVADGVRLGRQTFANTLKYVRVTISANFGNMLSMATASALLPFLPLLPRQVLLLNLLTDVPGTTIATDSVDPEQLASPRRWDLRSIRRFMLIFGMISTVFDLATFGVLRLGFDASADVFRSGWFIESTLTELTVMLVLRTGRPFIRSRPSRALLGSSVAVAAAALILPYLPGISAGLGLAALPLPILAALLGLTVAYALINEFAKRRWPIT
jgi:Mg2+-importing ATPase